MGLDDLKLPSDAEEEDVDDLAGDDYGDEEDEDDDGPGLDDYDDEEDFGEGIVDDYGDEAPKKRKAKEDEDMDEEDGEEEMEAVFDQANENKEMDIVENLRERAADDA